MKAGGCLRLGVAAALGVAALLTVGPRVAPRLFPAPGGGEQPPVSVAVDAESVVAHALAGWGTPSGEVLHLPRGRGPDALQRLLRERPELTGTEVYVTPTDDLTYRLRVLAGAQVLLDRPVLPWVPERAPAPPDAPPLLALLVELASPGADRVEALAGLPLPLAVALPPFASGTLAAVRAALRDRVDVVLLVDGAPLAEQLAAVPEASALRASAPGAPSTLPWLVDGGCGLRDDCAAVSSLEGGPDRLRALALRRGAAVLAVQDGDAERAADWLIEARADGYLLGFPAEARRRAAP